MGKITPFQNIQDIFISLRFLQSPASLNMIEEIYEASGKRINESCLSDTIYDNSNMSITRAKVYELLLNNVLDYKEQLKSQKVVPKAECFTLLVLIKELYRWNYEDVEEYKEAIINELLSLCNE